MKLPIVIGGVVAAAFMSLSVFAFARAADTSSGSVRSYAAETPLRSGTIVQLAGKDSQTVKIATQAEIKNMFGVTVDRNQLPLTLSNGNLKNEVFVAVAGTYNVLVSTQNGSIASGDFVTLSSVNGVAMKATTDDKTVFGRANANFDGKGITLGVTKLKDDKGNDAKEVTLGLVPVTIQIQRNPNEKSTKVKVPEVLERIGQAIAEKEVSPIRIYLSLGIMVISVVAAIAILYSGVRNGLISIGRNPMSRRSIFRALLSIVLTSIVILVIGLFAVYLLLKL